MTQLLSIREKNSFVEISLNRHSVRNALNEELIIELTGTLKKIDKDPAVRVVCLQGAGKYFCAGADLAWMQRASKFSRAENIKDAKRFSHLLETLSHLSKPTLAIVQGGAFGGALGLLACCDIVIAATNTVYAFPEARVGLMPAIIYPYIIQAIGERQARRYFLTAEEFSAQTAHSLGLIHEIVPPQALDTMRENMLAHIKQCSPNALKMTKQLFPAVDKKTINKTITALAKIRSSTEGRKGIQAFLDKRPPIW